MRCIILLCSQIHAAQQDFLEKELLFVRSAELGEAWQALKLGTIPFRPEQRERLGQRQLPSTMPHKDEVVLAEMHNLNANALFDSFFERAIVVTEAFYGTSSDQQPLARSFEEQIMVSELDMAWTSVFSGLRNVLANNLRQLRTLQSLKQQRRPQLL